MVDLNEIAYQNYLIKCPQTIEKDLIFIERETPINGRKCDLLFYDSSNNKLYIEVKVKVDDAAIGQILVYRALSTDKDARFMIVAQQIGSIYKRVLDEYRIPYKIIKKDEFSKSNIPLFITTLKGDSLYKTKEEVIADLKTDYAKKVTNQIYDYIIIKCEGDKIGLTINISDGLMFYRDERSTKFCSITTKLLEGKNRLLIHVPSKKRDAIYNEFKQRIPALMKAKDMKSQFDIFIDEISSEHVPALYELIDYAIEIR